MLMKNILAIALIASTSSANAAIALDRTRIIFPGNAKSISLTITNENKEIPYLAQSWLENKKGEKISAPFLISPPLQRVEGGKNAIIRINNIDTGSLPQDRESVYWFSVREVPPKSDKPNVLQVALQTKIKLFYRPEGIIPDKSARWDDQLILHPTSGGFNVENPTPYYVTILAITGGEKDIVDKEFQPVMLAPKSTSLVASKTFKTPYVTTINDYGGKPKLPFKCNGDSCKAVKS